MKFSPSIKVTLIVSFWIPSPLLSGICNLRLSDTGPRYQPADYVITCPLWHHCHICVCVKLGTFIRPLPIRHLYKLVNSLFHCDLLILFFCLQSHKYSVPLGYSHIFNTMKHSCGRIYIAVYLSIIQYLSSVFCCILNGITYVQVIKQNVVCVSNVMFVAYSIIKCWRDGYNYRWYLVYKKARHSVISCTTFLFCGFEWSL